MFISELDCLGYGGRSSADVTQALMTLASPKGQVCNFYILCWVSSAPEQSQGDVQHKKGCHTVHPDAAWEKVAPSPLDSPTPGGVARCGRGVPPPGPRRNH